MRICAALIVLISLTAGCSSVQVQQVIEQPTASTSAPSTVTGSWEFSVTGGKGAYSTTFALTDEPAETCLSGNWYRAQLVSDGSPQVSSPAYSYEAGRLELLLSTELCDSYSSFIGKVAGDRFVGEHVSYGLRGSTTHGKVTGVLRP